MDVCQAGHPMVQPGYWQGEPGGQWSSHRVGTAGRVQVQRGADPSHARGDLERKERPCEVQVFQTAFKICLILFDMIFLFFLDIHI